MSQIKSDARKAYFKRWGKDNNMDELNMDCQDVEKFYPTKESEVLKIIKQYNLERLQFSQSHLPSIREGGVMIDENDAPELGLEWDDE